MNLTPEQLAQCREDFEAHFDVSPTMWLEHRGEYMRSVQEKFTGYQAAWRPVPSVEEIENTFTLAYEPTTPAGWQRGFEAIHRAFGGEE